jgi:hypothetical protein
MKSNQTYVYTYKNGVISIGPSVFVIAFLPYRVHGACAIKALRTIPICSWAAT